MQKRNDVIMSRENMNFSINHVAFDHYKRYQDELPNVITVRDTKTLNKYIDAGHEFSIVQREVCQSLMTYHLVFQSKDSGRVESIIVGKNKKTDKWIDIRDRRFNLFKPLDEYLKNDRLLAQHEYYQGRHPSEYPWGAYVLPIGVKQGQKVYIGDIIEDVSAGGFWALRTRFGNAIGQWDGKSIVLDERVSKDAFWDTGMVG